MQRWRLSLAWDGTDYVGWQRQPNGLSVQEVLETKLGVIFGVPRLAASPSGRTDSGVHARVQWVAFDAPSHIETERLVASLNGLLPSDIACIDATPMPDGYDPRRAAVRKLYRYRALNRPARCPYRSRYTWHIRQPLDLPAMQTAAACLLGTHDFSSFRAARCAAKTTVRTMESVSVASAPDGEIHFDFVGKGFLRHQVRIMVGTLIEMGRGYRSCEDMPEILAAMDRSKAGRTAASKGLWLMWLQDR